MSGSNPFRPKKPENPTGHQHQHQYARSASPPSIASDPIFLRSLSSAAVAAPQPNLPSTPTGLAPTATPPSPMKAANVDNSVTTDDESTSDPFNQDSDLSDDDAESPRSSPGISISAPSGDIPHTHRRPGQTGHATPPSISSSEVHATTVVQSVDGPPGTDNGLRPTCPANYGISRDTVITSSTAASTSASLGGADDDRSTADVFRPSARTEMPGRPISSAADIDSKALNYRPGNKERIPPPPPKSHHGKAIRPGSNRNLPTSQTMPSEAASRFSFHGSSPGPSITPQASERDPAYFAIPHTPGQSEMSSDTLRRSQSQHKRPPTPPLSRRYSQMRRSKSTLSKPTSSQLPILPASIQATASTRSSPGSWSSTPSLSRKYRRDSSLPGEASSNLTLHTENTAPASSTSSMEGSGGLSNLGTTSKRASLVSPLPPPPPPRRSRWASSRGDDGDYLPSLRSEQRADGLENLVPHPSNARDILADLTRLQKEVDDLRGHYESRRGR